jgi:AraC-like DNA-binding protein
MLAGLVVPRKPARSCRSAAAGEDAGLPGSSAERAMKVAAVAHAVGYAPQAALSRAFEKAEGIAPAAWRDRHLGRPGPGRPAADGATADR